MKGEIAVRYTIRHFDLPLLTFEANMDSADTGLHFIKVYEENRSFLPLNLTVSEDGVERWLRHRAIPKNRAYVDALLSKVGLSLNRPLGIIAANKGLSLNDCFWVDKGFLEIINVVQYGSSGCLDSFRNHASTDITGRKRIADIVQQECKDIT